MNGLDINPIFTDKEAEMVNAELHEVTLNPDSDFNLDQIVSYDDTSSLALVDIANSLRQILLMLEDRL